MYFTAFPVCSNIVLNLISQIPSVYLTISSSLSYTVFFNLLIMRSGGAL